MAAWSVRDDEGSSSSRFGVNYQFVLYLVSGLFEIGSFPIDPFARIGTVNNLLTVDHNARRKMRAKEIPGANANAIRVSIG